jgi:hypothetical protein
VTGRSDGSPSGGLVDGAVALGPGVGQEIVHANWFLGELIQRVGEVEPRIQPVPLGTGAQAHQHRSGRYWHNAPRELRLCRLVIGI